MIKKQNFFTTYAVVVFMFALIIPVTKAGEHESTKVDIAIDDKDFLVTKLSDKLFEAVIVIRNRGPVPLPNFKVYFYAGDPDKGGRLLSHPSQSAGPIMPGSTWAEAIHPHRLKPGEDTISVVLDPDNKIEESDETNNKVLRSISTIVSEFEKVRKVVAIQKFGLSDDDILLIEAEASEDFNFPYYLFIPGGIDKSCPVYILVEPNNSGMVSDDPEVHQAKALTLVEKSHANKIARRLGVPLLVPTFPRPMSNWLAYTHALDIDTLEITEGKLRRVDLQLTAMIKHAQELLRTNGFKINDKIFIHGFSASAKFCNRYSYLHPEMVKAAAAGGVNGLPTLPVREWNGYELPFPIGLAGIERFTGKPFDEKAFMQVAHFIYMGSSDKNDTLPSRDAYQACEAWRKEEADIIWKALAAEKMMPDRWELSRKIYRQQQLPAQLVTYNGVGHSIKSEMLDDVINFFKANAGEKYVPIEPYEYSSFDPDNTARKSDETNKEASKTTSGEERPETQTGQKQKTSLTPDKIKSMTFRERCVWVIADGSKSTSSTWHIFHYTHNSIRRDTYEGDSSEPQETQWYSQDGQPEGALDLNLDPIENLFIRHSAGYLHKADKLLGEKVINERKCLGFEISASKYGSNPAEWMDCIWFDSETKLPVYIEMRGRPVSSLPDWTQTMMRDKFEYNTD